MFDVAKIRFIFRTLNDFAKYLSLFKKWMIITQYLSGISRTNLSISFSTNMRFSVTKVSTSSTSFVSSKILSINLSTLTWISSCIFFNLVIVILFRRCILYQSQSLYKLRLLLKATGRSKNAHYSEDTIDVI